MVVVARIYYTLTTWNVAFLQAGAVYLVFFEIPLGIVAGLAIAGLVLLGIHIVPRHAPLIARAIITGIIAWGSSSVFVALYTNNLTMSWNPWVVGSISGIVVGLAFSVVGHLPAKAKTPEK